MRVDLRAVIRHPTTHKVAIGTGAFGAGVIFGYLLGKRAPRPLPPRTKEEIDRIAADVERIRQRRLERQKPVVDAEEYKKIAAKYAPNEVGDEVELEDGEIGKVIAVIEPDGNGEDEPEVITRNVFAEAAADDDWNYDVEVRNRDSSEPYVLHKDEFYADEMGFSQHTYTLYEGDDILVDEEDKPIYNHLTVTGELKFGHGSGDMNVVYIRNEQRREEYEIVKDPGLYSVEVLGLNIENNERARGIEHSVPRRFKPQE